MRTLAQKIHEADSKEALDIIASGIVAVSESHMESGAALHALKIRAAALKMNGSTHVQNALAVLERKVNPSGIPDW